MTKVYDNATDLITFARSSSGTALRRVGYGDELVVDGAGNWVGDFDVAADVSEWTTVGGGTVEIFEGTLKINRVSGGVAAIYELTGLTVGKVYSFDFDLVAGEPRVDVSTKGTTVPGTSVYSAGKNSFVATSETLYLRFSLNTGNGTSGQFDNISVREVIFDRATDDLVLFNHPDDIPRIEYAADGSLKGLLIEEQRTNLVTYSEDFSNAEWTATQSGLDSISVSSETTPDGLTNAYEITEDNTATVHYFQDGVSGLSATSYTLSLFARQGSGTRYLQLRTGGAGIFANFDLSTGNVVDSGGAYILQANIEDFGNNWYRCSVAGDFAVAPSSYQIILSNSTGAAPSYTGDGTSSILIYGAQLEEGSFATSYIPTSGGQKTRDPDIASIPVTAFGYNQQAGTVVVEFDMLSDNAGTVHLTQAAFGFHDGTSNNRLELWSASAGTLTLRDRVAPTNYDATSTGNSLEQSTKSAASYASGEASKLVVNGGTASVAGTATTPPAYSTLLLGDTQNVDAELNGHIKSLQYYPRRLTDAQLQELTS